MERNASSLRELEPAAMEPLIYRCAELHVDHIATSGAPFEFGSARPLDFGHWAAHKLEQLSEYKIRHGEAVAVGIALDVIYSRRMGFLDATEAERVLRLIEALGFDLFANELLNVDSSGDFVILKGLEEFREHLGGQLTITLLKSIGTGFEVHEMNDAIVFESIQELQARQNERALRFVGGKPRPIYPADGRKVFDIYTAPLSIRAAIKNDLGEFPFPTFWGPAAGVPSPQGPPEAASRWIAESAKWIENQSHPTLSLIYLPHLDYNLQRLGPSHPRVPPDFKLIHEIARALIHFFRRQSLPVLVPSEDSLT